MKMESIGAMTTPSGVNYLRWRIGRWTVELNNDNGFAGWVIQNYSQDAIQREPRSQSWCRHLNGNIAFDYPEEIPKYVIEAIKKITGEDGRWKMEKKRV